MVPRCLSRQVEPCLGQPTQPTMANRLRSGTATIAVEMRCHYNATYCYVMYIASMSAGRLVGPANPLCLARFAHPQPVEWAVHISSSTVQRLGCRLSWS